MAFKPPVRVTHICAVRWCVVFPQGASALKKYSCLIVDELHERSVESDLLLACVHAMMVPAAAAAAAAEPELPSLKLVLTSATANVERYRYLAAATLQHIVRLAIDTAVMCLGQPANVVLLGVLHLWCDAGLLCAPCAAL